GAVLRAWDERGNLLCEVPSNDQVTCTFAGALQPGEGIAGQTALRREVLAIEDYAAWEHAIPTAIERGVRSAVAAPLLVGDRVIGVLTALFHSPSRFDNQQTDVLKLLVAQVAPAVAA